MKKVLIPTKLDAVAKETLQASGQYSVVQDDTTEFAKLAAANSDAYALIVRSEKVTPAIMDAIPALKVIIRAGAGYNNIDTRYARKKGIDVMNTPGANANAVAEEVIAMMLADARHLVEGDLTTRKGEWEKKKFMGREISGKTIGIIGLGAIGRLVAKRLEGFSMKMLGYDPVISADRARELGIEPADIEEIFRKCDYITLHIPANDETRGMVNKKLLGLMKNNVTLINCARCEVINEDDLRAIRQEKKIRFLNDVYPEDKAGPKSVADIADLMLPHLGANTKEANWNAALRSAEQLIEFDTKGVTSYIVNRDIPAGLDEAYAELAFTITKLCRLVAGKEHPLKMVEASFYGSLQPYATWLVVPIVCALNEEFDRSLDNKAAVKFLRDLGVEYNNRQVDASKPFDNSITIDLTFGTSASAYRTVSVRGTIAEGNLMISRINNFDKLYFEPKGHNLAFTYQDRPGVLAQISSKLAAAGINIDDVRNPHDESGKRSLALLKVNQAVDAELVKAIGKEIKADFAVYAGL